MIDEKNIEERLSQIEAAARLILNEAEKIRSMFEAKEKSVKIDTDRIKFYQRVNRSLNKKTEIGKKVKSHSSL